MDAGIQITDG